MLPEEHSLVPEWARVKFAAVLGVGTPLAASFIDKLGPVIDFLIKVGQFGVTVVTILYIVAKWRKIRNKKEK